MIDFLQNYHNIIHYFLHFFGPGFIAYFFFKNYWQKAWIIMIVTMLIDLDHLLANPIFDPNRCSISFHPLHTIPAIIFYIFLIIIPNKYSRILGSGLILHMFVDLIDCLLM